MYKVAKEASEPYYLVTIKYDYGEDDATDVIKIKKEEFNENTQKALRVLEKFTETDITDKCFLLPPFPGSSLPSYEETLKEIFPEKEELDILKILLSSSFVSYDEFIKSTDDCNLTREFFESYINFNKDWMLRGAFGNGWSEALGPCRLVSVEVIYIDKGYEVDWEEAIEKFG